MADSGGYSSGGSFLVARTPILGLRLYIVILFTVLIVLAVFLAIFLFLRSRRRRVAIRLARFVSEDVSNQKSAVREVAEVSKVVVVGDGGSKRGSSESKGSTTGRSDSSSVVSGSTDGIGSGGWGRWYSLRELQMATNQFSAENVVGEGGYGIVYRGVLPDGSMVAVKHLLNKKGQAEREFKVEVEAIGKVKHKNLVSLLGYCAEEAQRLLVYEYVNNGNLEQWLHGDVGPVSPLTWEIRMKIAVGTARGLAYLHEGLEPKVVHRDVKSSNILLDRKWNPKVSDFGLAKILGPDKGYVTTRVMGTFGYVSPDYASTGMLNERSDVYSFGVLLMEIITGRPPVDYRKPAAEMNLVDWVKAMISSRRSEELVDRLIDVPPCSRALKRILLICLRCIDSDSDKRPKMGQIVHMLESDESSYRSELSSHRETPLPLLTQGAVKVDASRSPPLLS